MPTTALCTQQYLFKVSKISHHALCHKGPSKVVTKFPVFTAAFVCLLLLMHLSDTDVGVTFPKRGLINPGDGNIETLLEWMC